MMHDHHIRTQPDDVPSDAVIARVTPCHPDEAAAMLALPVDDDNRSQWCWVRLAEGTLMFACFPQGDAYDELSQAGVCDIHEGPSA